MADSTPGGLSVGGIFNFLVATDTAAGQAKLNKSLYKKQRAENQKSAKESDIARWSQSLTNSKLFDRSGKSYATVTENLGRAQDTQTLSKFQRELILSERLGAATAAYASMGVGGSSVESYNRTTETAAAIESEQQDRNFKSSNYLAEQQRGSIMTDAVDGMSRDIIGANLDMTNYGPTKGPSLLGNVATLAIAAAASAAGAPDVGNAILNARTSGLQRGYGDSTGAAKSFGNALDNMKEGVRQVRNIFQFTPSGPTPQELRIADSVSRPASGGSYIMR